MPADISEVRGDARGNISKAGWFPHVVEAERLEEGSSKISC